MATLYIQISRPHWGNYKHWALLLVPNSPKNPNPNSPNLQSTLYQLTNQHPSFVKSKTTAISKDPDIIANILVASLRPSDISEVSKAFEEAPVDNETLEWTCQDFVLEMLEKLREWEVIDDGEVEVYEEGRNEALGYYGPG